MAQNKELRNDWACLKTQRTMSMTVDAWNLLGELAETGQMSRSEVLEVMLRRCHESGFDPETEKTLIFHKSLAVRKRDYPLFGKGSKQTAPEPEEVAVPT